MSLPIDLAGDRFVVDLSTHAVHIPATLKGIKCLQRLLRARQDRTRTDKRIGTDASPTQSMIDAWLKAHAHDDGEELDLGEISL